MLHYSFFDKNGNYKLANNLEEAYRAGFQTNFKRILLKLIACNLLYSALEGKVMRIFPIPNDPNNKWVSYPELDGANFEKILYT